MILDVEKLAFGAGKHIMKNKKKLQLTQKKKQISLVTGMIRSLQKFPKYIIILMLKPIIMTITRITLISPIVYLLSSLNWTN